MHPIIALSVLEAVRASDLAKGDPPEDAHVGQEAIRLGRTTSVAAQIDRYSAMVRRRDSLDLEELSALYTLVARRPDADLVFADAGRRAGRHAAKQTPGLLRAMHRTLPRGLRERLGQRLIRRAAARVFAIDMAYDSTSAAAVETCGARAIPGGRPCALYGSGLAELLRIFTSFDGAYFRIACRARGDATCKWSTTQAHEA
jgi:hypothetical protein